MVNLHNRWISFFFIVICLNLCSVRLYSESEFQTHLQKANLYASQREFVKAVEHLSEAIKIQPREVEVHVQFAIVCSRLGWIDKAVESYAIVLHLDPNSPSAQYGLKVLGHYQIGLIYARKGAFEKAKTQYQLAIGLDPELALPHFQLGYLLTQQGKFEEAIPCYQKALALYPDHTGAYYQLANAYFRMGKQEEGKRQLERFREIKAKERFNLAEQSLKEGEIDEALTAFQRALDMDAAFAPAYARLSAIALQQNDLETAAEYLQQALEIRPNFAAGHYQLGSIYHKKGEAEKAIESFETALQLRPNFAPACNALAWLYAESEKNIDEAISLATRAVKLKPTASYWDTLAYALYKAQRYKDAAAAIATAVDLQPNDPDYVARQKLIQKAIAEQKK
ncbi:tetratricopeptide repeat protein [Candidatus Poribacteria bacterium]|nr:tetratricopeptide repeat protein [Candidatus Poribacteria bacterium]